MNNPQEEKQSLLGHILGRDIPVHQKNKSLDVERNDEQQTLLVNEKVLSMDQLGGDGTKKTSVANKTNNDNVTEILGGHAQNQV